MLKKLLLLGLLRDQRMHGYGLMGYLKLHETSGSAIGKSNAYRLLRVMEDEGLVRSCAEKEGNRPERRVYEVTAKGDQYFLDTLKTTLATDTTSDQPGIAVLEFVEALEPDVAAVHLAMRRANVANRHSVLTRLPAEVQAMLPALDLKLRITEVELEWLDAKLVELHAQTNSLENVNQKQATR
jgi:DNA-binding PadR family transcriptional regulator